MSYILEALKKLEQRREREEPYRATTFSEERVPDRRKHALWPHLLVVLLLVNAVLMVWWIAPWHSGDGAKDAKTTPDRRSTASGLVKTGHGKERDPARDAALSSQGRTRNGSSAQTLERSATRAGAAAPVLPGSRTSTEPPEQKSSVPADKVFTLNELPPSVKDALPEFRISGHTYSTEPRARVVMLNGAVLKERQDLEPGLRVEEIVPTGVILSYQGYRFRVSLKNLP